MTDKKKLVRFIVIGLSNTLVSFIVFQAMLQSLPETDWIGGLAQSVSYFAGVIWSFAWNRRWTFESAGIVHHEALRFAILNITALVASTLALHLLVDILQGSATLSWVAVMGVITVANYLVMRNWVFAR